MVFFYTDPKEVFKSCVTQENDLEKWENHKRKILLELNKQKFVCMSNDQSQPHQYVTFKVHHYHMTSYKNAV